MTEEQEEKKRIEDGRAILKTEGITFSLFKAVLSVLLTSPIDDEDFMIELYQDYAGDRTMHVQSIEDWAEDHFTEWNLDKHSTMLRSKHRFEMPTDDDIFNIAVLFNGGKLEKGKLADMCAMTDFILDRLHEHGNVKTKSSREIEMEAEGDS